MQNPQMAGMAGMNMPQGPVDGTPVMGNGQRRPQQLDPRDQLNTYIYDYFLRNNHLRAARTMIECDMKLNLNPSQKPSPSGRNINGVDGMDQDSKDDMPTPKIPSGHSADNSFLLDWWVQFWDIWGAARKHNPKNVPLQYISHARNLTQMQNDQRAQRMMMNGPMGANYPNMMRLPNGVASNDLKRAAAMNNHNPNGNAMVNMNQMKNAGAMMGAQMQRDGSQMEINGQRSQSPGSNENGAPSPNKRPRVEGGMNGGNMPGAQFSEFNPNAPNVQQKQIEVYAQSLVQQQRMALNNHAHAQGMNSGVQGSPMAQTGLEGQHDMFAGNAPRNGIPAGTAGAPQGNHALQDYQMQLMLLEQQNKKRLLMARQEQDNMAPPHGQGGPGFAPSMSPQGSRAGPSPSPADQMKKGTPRMGQPGSPMPEGAMQQQRNSPAPAMPGAGFDPNGANMPPGMHQYGFPGQMPQGPMMARPPSSHPGGFAGQQLTPQQMEAMQRNGAMQNGGVWRGPQGQPGMMANPQQMGPMGQNPQQRGNMPPPPAPPAGEQQQARAEPSPSQTAQAPPTPSTGNKAAPKKKGTKDAKKPANKKGANTGSTSAASGAEEPPTPSTPVTPMHPKTFSQNGQPPPSQPPAQQQPPTAPQQQQSMEIPPFGNNLDDSNGFNDLGALGFGDDNALENFDFDSFLHVGDDSNGLGTFSGDFAFEVEASGDQ